MEMTVQEAISLWRSHTTERERRGVYLPEAVGYASDAVKMDYTMAMDAVPSLVTVPSSSVPMMLTTFIDPDLVRILYAPLMAAEILGEQRKGDWLMETAMFPVIEATGEVASYGDFNEDGRAGLNVTFPQRQAYRYQIIIEYGDLEIERAGLARVNWVADLQKSAALSMNKFQNYTYFYGLNGLQNYGMEHIK